MITNSIHGEKFAAGGHCAVVYSYYNLEWRNFNMQPHSHDRIELMHITRGRCKVILENEIFEMERGDCIFIDAGILHSLQVEEEDSCRILNVEFGFEKGGSIIDVPKLIAASEAFKLLIGNEKGYFLSGDNDELEAILKRIIRELDEKSSYGSHMINLLIYQLLEVVGRNLERSREDEGDKMAFHMRKAVKYINDNIGKELKIEDIAQQVNLHPNYLQRIFKKQMGDTLVDYFQKQRIKKAEMLLAYTNMSIIDMAMELGFGSRQYFSYVFKRYKGLSPQEFRNHH